MLADNSHEISYLICRKQGKLSQNLSSAAVMIGALRVKGSTGMSNSVHPDQAWFALAHFSENLM